MKNLYLAFALLMLTTATAHASYNYPKDHSLDNLYTKALNNLAAAGMLDTIDKSRHTTIKDMHIDHGQIVFTLEEVSGTEIIIYDLIGNKISWPQKMSVQPENE